MSLFEENEDVSFQQGDVSPKQKVKRKIEEVDEVKEVVAAPVTFTKGKRYRVIKNGARITGMVSLGYGAFTGFSCKLPIGTIITCSGSSMSFGDGVPLVKWTDEKGNFICNDAEFSPSVGGMWNRQPDSSYLEVCDL